MSPGAPSRGGKLPRALRACDEAIRQHRREALAAVVIGAVGAGAALGAGTHPQSPTYRAEALVRVEAPAGQSQSTAWRTLADVLGLSSLRARVAKQAGEVGSTPTLGAAGDPQSSLISIYATASSREQAELLANTAAAASVSFLTETVGGSAVSSSTFDSSTESWDLGSGLYVLPPARATRTTASHSGAGALQVRCATQVLGGCGPFLRLERPFLRGTTYAAQGWVKAPRGTRLRLVLGSAPEEVGVGATISASGAWQRLTVGWIPGRASEDAVVAFQVLTRGNSSLAIDDVAVADQQALSRGRPSPTRGARYSTVLPATSSSTLSSIHTVRWALGGALAGLLVGLAAAAAALAAARRDPAGEARFSGGDASEG